MITYVRFKTPVSLGSVDHNEWVAERPGSTSLLGKMVARYATDADRNTKPGDVIVEYRSGGDAYNVTVPRGNIGQIIEPAVVAEGKAKK